MYVFADNYDTMRTEVFVDWCHGMTHSWKFLFVSNHFKMVTIVATTLNSIKSEQGFHVKQKQKSDLFLRKVGAERKRPLKEKTHCSPLWRHKARNTQGAWKEPQKTEPPQSQEHKNKLYWVRQPFQCAVSKGTDIRCLGKVCKCTVSASKTPQLRHF